MRISTILAFLVLSGSQFLGCSNKVQIKEADTSPVFCKQWNPDFTYNKNRCCGFSPLVAAQTVKKKQKRYNVTRRKKGFCHEQAIEQVQYTQEILSDSTKDPLSIITLDQKQRREQAFCSVNDGFLAHGRNIIPSHKNHVKLRFPDRCTNFGTDQMIGMLEWIGQEIDKKYPYLKYPNVHLLIGDIAAPRGGSLWGHSLRMVHKSHSNGQDADIGFFTVKKGGKSPHNFHREFDPVRNWWLIKHIFQNPFACVKMSFLDKTAIAKLNVVAHKDPDWRRIRPYIIHAPGHHNHIHVRIGNAPGKPGCLIPKPILEDDIDDDDADDDQEESNNA